MTSINSDIKPDIKVQVDLYNPAQFFACCGLLELSSRLWPGSEGWFSDTEKRKSQFYVSTHGGKEDSLGMIIKKLTETDDVAEVDTSRGLAPGVSPITIRPFDLHLDWWNYLKLKTWAGQQTPKDIITDLCDKWKKSGTKVSPDVLDKYVLMGASFGFNPASSWKSIDIGFSPNEFTELKIPVFAVTEILAAVGLQRFYPKLIDDEKVEFHYCVWNTPLPVSVAPVAMVTDEIGCSPTVCEFQVKKRTGYYKEFTWSKPVSAVFEKSA